jgi:hypothetical protein
MIIISQRSSSQVRAAPIRICWGRVTKLLADSGQKTNDIKKSKERMHLDLETDDIEQEVRRLEALGAKRWDHQQERGFEFWVLQDPWGNEFCVLQQEFPELLTRRRPWAAPDGAPVDG